MEKIKKLDKEFIDALKKEHGKNLHQFNIPTEDGVVTFIAKKPSRATVSAITKYAADGKVDKVQDILVASCIIAGDEEKLEEGDIFFSVGEKLAELMKTKEVEVKKL